MEKMAFIGVGVMGKSMVLNLVKKGYVVNIYTRTKHKVNDIIKDNIIWHDTIASCIKDVDIIMTMVGFPSDVEEIYFGDTGILNLAKKGAICIDFTTSSPSLAKKIYTTAKKLQIDALDCPVSGGDSGAKNATLSIMVGGDKEVFVNILPILQCLGQTIHHVGPAGFGQHTKMTNQIALAGAIAGVCEALTYANTVGLDGNTMLSCISSGAAGSWQMSNMAPRILADDFAPGFYIKHYIKDLNIASEVLENKEVSLRVLDTVNAMYQQLASKGMEELGTQALVKYYLSSK